MDDMLDNVENHYFLFFKETDIYSDCIAYTYRCCKCGQFTTRMVDNGKYIARYTKLEAAMYDCPGFRFINRGGKYEQSNFSDWLR